jgi:hypothetical protein
MLPRDGSLEIRCPRCGGRAAFDEPFQFISGRAAAGLPLEEMKRWGGWYVREKYPSLLRWKAPRGPEQYLTTGRDRLGGGYRLWHRGVVRCRACHLVAVHVLGWPGDAYFQWNVRGTRLWALDASHARVLLHYIESTLRDPARYPGYQRSLRKLPATILAARSRDVVARKIRATLQASGESVELSP